MTVDVKKGEIVSSGNVDNRAFSLNEGIVDDCPPYTERASPLLTKLTSDDDYNDISVHTGKKDCSPQVQTKQTSYLEKEPDKHRNVPEIIADTEKRGLCSHDVDTKAAEDCTTPSPKTTVRVEMGSSVSQTPRVSSSCCQGDNMSKKKPAFRITSHERLSDSNSLEISSDDKQPAFPVKPEMKRVTNSQSISANTASAKSGLNSDASKKGGSIYVKTCIVDAAPSSSKFNRQIVENKSKPLYLEPILTQKSRSFTNCHNSANGEIVKTGNHGNGNNGYTSLTLSKPPRSVNNFVEGDLEDDVFMSDVSSNADDMSEADDSFYFENDSNTIGKRPTVKDYRTSFETSGVFSNSNHNQTRDQQPSKSYAAPKKPTLSAHETGLQYGNQR